MGAHKQQASSENHAIYEAVGIRPLPSPPLRPAIHHVLLAIFLRGSHVEVCMCSRLKQVPRPLHGDARSTRVDDERRGAATTM
jgi:hypothetical protein